MQIYGSVREFIGGYKGVLLDQFGVLHDGRRAYPGAVEALKELHERKMAVYLLSNSSQRSQRAYGRLASMGFKQEWITEIVTSGEMTHRYLLNRRGPFWETLGNRCMHFTWNARGKIDLSELQLKIVTKPSEADFILVHGVDAIGTEDGKIRPQSTKDLLSLLDQFSKLKMKPPMIVANPDFVTVDGGSLATMPGTLGLHYGKLGGKVIWMGKPGRIIYDNVFDGSRLSPEDVVAVGDSMEHDIKGARMMGIDCIFVCGGIHAEEIYREGKLSTEELRKLCRKHGSMPNGFVEYFRL